METVGIATAGVGLVLVIAALRNQSPVDLVRQVLDPSRSDVEPAPIRAEGSAALGGAGSASSGYLGHAGEQIGNVLLGDKLSGLAEPLRSRTAALLDEAGGRVHIVSGRRSVAEQIELRRKHCGTTQYAVYEKPPGECSPPTARPGQSKHQRGEAVDLGGDLALAGRLASKHGMRRTVPGEPWHFEAT